MDKKTQLNKFKWIATGLFFLMAVLFIFSSIWEKKYSANWGYLRAFSEAAMVGALADWFAVTALFHHPLGLKIPHTNLIENSKAKIGDNLGSFVVENFLAPKNIRPYILKIEVAKIAGKWLSEKKNQSLLIHEISNILMDILIKIDNDSATKFISEKIKDFSNGLQINILAGNSIDYILDKKGHQQVITHISSEIKKFLAENQNIVKDRVKKESYFFIPNFVDDKIADKITNGIDKFFTEIQQDENHRIREEITLKLRSFASELKTLTRWENELNSLKNDFLKEENINTYATDIWKSIKENIISELQTPSSPMKTYLQKNLNTWANNLQEDEQMQHNIDHWVRITAYKYILKNTHQVGGMISSTVGNWQGRELSQKLELEVGKDLQYIRINGTLVGGLVGLIIYSIAQIFI